MCSVAAGQMDIYYEGGMWEWDICAAWVILKESGGLLTTANPSDEIDEPDLCGRMILAIRGAPKGDQERVIRQFWAQVAGDMSYSRVPATSCG